MKYKELVEIAGKCSEGKGLVIRGPTGGDRLLTSVFKNAKGNVWYCSGCKIRGGEILVKPLVARLSQINFRRYRNVQEILDYDDT